MVGSMDSLVDFYIEPMAEKNTTPLHCWQDISLSDIWISSHLLVNRNKGCNTGGLYHTLQKKDASKYAESFSVYIDSRIENEQEELFLSDSDEDVYDSVPTNLEEIKLLSNNLSPDSDDDAMNLHESFNHSEKKYSESVSNNASFRRNDGDMYSNLKTSNVSNLYSDETNIAKVPCLDKKYRDLDKGDNIFIQKTEKNDLKGSCGSSASKCESSEQFNDLKNVKSLKRVNSDADSHISLNEILNEVPVTSLKDFVCDFEYKKKDFDNSSICDKQKFKSKKSRKDKKGRKVEKLPLDSLFEDNNSTQEFNCNKYMNNILRERERFARIGDNPLCSKEEYPDLTPEELQKYSGNVDNTLRNEDNLNLTLQEFAFIHSDHKIKEEIVEFTPNFSYLHPDKSASVSYSEIVHSCENLNNLNTTEKNIEVEEAPSNFLCGRIVIENIPNDVSRDDISSILCGYGEVKNFSMISTGKCLKVFVEIDLTCDIDWVIECLNGSEPFGTSTGVLKCYQQK